MGQCQSIHGMWLLILWFVASGVIAEIPQEPRGLLNDDLRAARAWFLKTQFTDVYLENGIRNAAWDAQMIAALEVFEHHLAAQTDAQDLDNLRRQAVALVDAGCNDAMVGIVFAYAHRYFAGHKPSILHLRRTMERLRQQSYPPYVEYLAATYLAMHLRDDGENRDAEQFEKQAGRAAMRFIHSGVWQGDSLQSLLYVMDGQLRLAVDSVPEWERAEAFLTDAAAAPDIDPWIIAYWRGKLALNKAWSARGQGWAGDLREDQILRYDQYRQEAITFLAEAHRLAPHRPEPATLMIKVYWGNLNHPDQKQNPRFWFEQAVKAQFDYEGAYRWMSFTLLLRWGGTHAQGIAFARECLATGRFDTRVPYQALDILREIAERDFDGNYAALKKFNAFEIIQPALEGYLQTEQNEKLWRRYASELLLWCWMLNEKETARDVWQQLEGKFDPIARDGFDGLDYFHTGAIKTMIADGDEANVLSVRTKQFESGEWVDLTFTEDLAGWTSQGGDWRRVDEHTVEGRSSRDGLRLFLDLDVGRAFEFEGVVEFVQAAKPRYFAAGLFFAQRDENPELSRAMLLRHDEPGLMKIDDSNVPVKVAVADVTDRTAFRIQVIEGRARCWVGDELVYTGRWLLDDAEYEQRQEPAIGGFSRFRDGDVFRFSHLRVRRVEP